METTVGLGSYNCEDRRGPRWGDAGAPEQGSREVDGWTPSATVPFSNYSKISKLIQIWMMQRWPSIAITFSIKLWACGYWNKEQISLLVFFEIWDIIWIKNKRTKLSQIWLILNSRNLEDLDFDRIFHVGWTSNFEHLSCCELLPNLHRCWIIPGFFSTLIWQPCNQIGYLEFLLQMHQSFNLDKEYLMVIYEYWTMIWVAYIH
jgi:hypothetical protein